MNCLRLCVFALLAELSFCQTHIGVVTGQVNDWTTCYNCDDHRTFPSCLSDPVVCGPYEVCRFIYGDGGPRIGCEDATHCIAETSNPLHTCQGGGVEVAKYKCQKCCSKHACVADLVKLLRTEFPDHLTLRCPDGCDPTNWQPCFDHPELCQEGEFCQLEKDHGHVKGGCRKLHEYTKCLDHLEHDRCTAGHGGDKCTYECCTNNACINSHFVGGTHTTTTTEAPSAAITWVDRA